MDEAFAAVYNQILLEVASSVEKALNDAKPHLKKRIEADVYKVYSPTVYKRRSDDSTLGVSLAAQAITEPYTSVIKPGGGNVNGMLQVTSRLYYNPQGNHKRKKWHTADYDDLIGRIEKKSPPYTWGQAQVPERPFWQNFVDEMVGGGELERLFVDAMKSAEPTIVADGNITEDASDREY